METGLRVMMDASGITYRRLSELTGVSVASISKARKNPWKCECDVIKRLCRFFCCRSDDIFDIWED
jgi:DNA-binding Xre family transcriptional regulator